LEKLALHIESLIFSASPSISFDDIKNALEESLGTPFSDEEVADQIGILMENMLKTIMLSK